MIYPLARSSIITFQKKRRYLCQKSLTTHIWMARDLLSKICAKLIDSIKQTILSDAFLIKFRNSPTAFTRNRKLPFHFLILFLINFVKRSYQDELDNFFKTIKGFKVAKRVVNKAALSTARKNLNYKAFVELNNRQTDLFYNDFSPITWKGFRLVCFDGTLLRLPDTPEIREHFGQWGSGKGDPCPMARASQMFDPLNKITLDAIISPVSISERSMAIQHCNNLCLGDLVLLDRGYPAFWLFALILSKKANLCVRVSPAKWKIIKKFYLSGQRQRTVKIPVPINAVTKCKTLGLSTDPITLRLIRVELDSGETEILITSLLDTNQYPWELFQELYHLRWPVEEDYKTIKCRIEIENFSGKSVLSVYQDFHAKIFSKNFTSILAFPTREQIKEDSKRKKHEYQINFTQALSKTKGVIVLLFQRSKRQFCRLIEDLHEIFVKTVEKINYGRSYPRKRKSLREKYSLNYKPIS